MKKIKVEVPVYIKVEKEYIGEGVLIMDGTDVNEVADFILTEEGTEYFKKNMNFICRGNEEKVDRNYKIGEYEVSEADYE